MSANGSRGMPYLRPTEAYAGGGAALAFAVLSVVVATAAFPLGADLAVTRALQRAIPEDTPAVSLVLVGQWTEMVLLPAFVLIAAWFRRWMALLLVPLAAPALLLVGVLKDIIGQPRPSPELVQVLVEADGLGYPSGGATSTIILLGLILYFLLGADGGLARRRWSSRGIAAAVAVVFLWDNLARVYSGRHWMTDAAGGWLFGFLWLLLLVALWRWWQDWSERRRAVPERTTGNDT